jgi:hypothetical protein
MTTLGCTGALGTNFVQPRSDGNTNQYHKYHAFVFKVPGLGQYTLDYIAMAGSSTSYNWYNQRSRYTWRLVSVDPATGKPDFNTIYVYEHAASDEALSYNWGSTVGGCKVPMPAGVVLDRETQYALVAKGTSNVTLGARAIATTEVPTGSAFNSWWANSVASEPPTEAQWNDGLYGSQNNLYAEVGYTTTTIKLTTIVVASPTVLNVHFSHGMRQAEAEDETKWTVTKSGGGTVPGFTATRQAEINKVQLVFESALEGGYTVEATSLVDADGVAIDPSYDSQIVSIGGGGNRSFAVLL